MTADTIPALARLWPLLLALCGMATLPPPRATADEALVKRTYAYKTVGDTQVRADVYGPDDGRAPVAGSNENAIPFCGPRPLPKMETISPGATAPGCELNALTIFEMENCGPVGGSGGASIHNSLFSPVEVVPPKNTSVPRSEI